MRSFISFLFIDFHIIILNDRNVLHLVSLEGYKEIVELLIEKFIENKINLNQKDEDGRNPLHLACSNKWKENKETVDLLINKRIDLNAKDNNGRIPLDLAQLNGRKEIVNLLISKYIENGDGVNLNPKKSCIIS